MWQNKQRIIHIDNLTDKMVSHALGATVLLQENHIRIYFSSRTKDNKSLPYYLDVSIDNPSNILHIEKTPLFELGELGTFDDDGIMPCSVVDLGNGTIFMYYVGWNRGVTVSYRNSIGLAVSKDNGHSFQRMFQGPVIDRCKNEPHMAASPCILKLGNTWHGWYTSGTKWSIVDGKTEPIYTIRYATSKDGINWERDGHTCIKQTHEQEAFARPTVLYENNIYKMWYNFRDSQDYRDGAGSYRLGYAESENGRDWIRKDNEIIIPESDANSWDSYMQCYPNILKTEKELLLFYNGNGFGRDGLGYVSQEV